MNRLWVWISGVILVAVLIVSLFPFITRSLARATGNRPEFHQGPPLAGQETETFRAGLERRILIDVSKTLVVGAIIGLLAGVLITRWLVAPLQQLDTGAKAVAGKQLDYRVPVVGSREMRSVAESFNQMASELEQQEDLRKNMLADVTHELRHPVHILQGSLQAILDGVYPLSMQEIDRMLEQTQNLTSLVNDLHELALAEAHELPLNKQMLDLVELVRNVTETIEPLATQQGIRFQASYPEKALMNCVDAGRYRQVMLNLLGNALRYTPEGGEISLSIERQDGIDRLVIRDSGAGIAPENLLRVFDRFYREDSSRNRDLPGAGLGLAIAQAIIQAHGGDIHVDSLGLNQGSAFTVSLPVSD
jgi:two-component system sensor histidine kinase BaeS